jgi:hypothetical protein
MSDLNQPLKESYIAKVGAIIAPYTDELKAKDFDPTSRITKLSGAGKEIETAGKERKKKEKELKDAIEAEQNLRTTYYTLATATVSLVEGVVGKDHEVVVKLRKLRHDLIGNQNPDGSAGDGATPAAPTK